MLIFIFKQVEHFIFIQRKHTTGQECLVHTMCPDYGPYLKKFLLCKNQMAGSALADLYEWTEKKHFFVLKHEGWDEPITLADCNHNNKAPTL